MQNIQNIKYQMIVYRYNPDSQACRDLSRACYQCLITERQQILRSL